MYQALGLPRLLTIFGAITAAILMALFYLHNPTNPLDMFKLASQAASWAALSIIVIGQTFVFRLIWQIPLCQTLFFPYIHGKWAGTISSNWSVISKLREAATDSNNAVSIDDIDYRSLGGYTKPAEVEIKASLLTVTMKLIPQDAYSDSFTVFVKPVKDGENGYPRLYYMYRSSVRVPESTDAHVHFGAAWLDIQKEEKNLVLKGVYWTDREWTKGINTAGELNAKKVS